jgi:hypothetical protein
MSAILIVLFALHLLVVSKQFKNLRLLGQLTLAVVLAGAIVAPFALHVLWYQVSRTYPDDLFADPTSGGLSSPVYYFLPSEFHPLWGQSLWERLGNTWLRPRLHVPFVGYTVFILSMVGLVKQWKHGRIWGVSVLIIAALALGPVLKMGKDCAITLPYADLYQRTVVPVLRNPDRFNILMVIPLSVLAALGGHACGIEAG